MDYIVLDSQGREMGWNRIEAMKVLLRRDMPALRVGNCKNSESECDTFFIVIVGSEESPSSGMKKE